MTRDCDLCGLADDLPRHVIQLPPGTPALIRHMSCCANAGCGVCQETESTNEKVA